MKLLRDHYVGSLQRSVRKGEIQMFEDKELEALSSVFQAARSYLYLKYVKESSKARKLPGRRKCI